jgi:UDP-2,3-diacylglucosamine pyrophosphatase LpxH
MNCTRCQTNMHKNGTRDGKQRWLCPQCKYEIQERKKSLSSNVLCISDLHFPYVHPKALRFCSDLYKEYKCDTVVFLGDLFDFSGMSLHVKNPDGKSSGDEVKEAICVIEEWADEFPEAKVCWGNHEMRLQKRFKEAGIPNMFLPSLNNVFNLPNEWEWAFHHEIDNVRYMHSNSSGMYLHARLPKNYMQSVVHAHTHITGAIQFMSTDNDLVFGMNCGCLIDTKSFAFEYAKDFDTRPVLGTGVVLDNGKIPMFIPMEL